MRAVHLDVKQLRQRLHDHIERSCEQQNAVAGALVLPDPPHAFGIDAAKGHRVERLAAKSLHHLRVEPVVLAIEAALKLRSRASLQEEPARPFAKHVRHEGGPVLEWLRAEAHPQEVLHDVGLDERSVDVEHSQHVIAAGATLDRRADRAGLCLGRGAPARLLALARDCFRARHAHHRRKVHVLEVVRPVVQRGVERKGLSLCCRHLIPQLHHMARVEDAVDLRVHAVELDQVEPAVEPVALGGQVVRHLCDARSERQALDDPLRRLNESQRGACPRRHLLAGGIGP